MWDAKMLLFSAQKLDVKVREYEEDEEEEGRCEVRITGTMRLIPGSWRQGL
jgi:hypothetical protein